MLFLISLFNLGKQLQKKCIFVKTFKCNYIEFIIYVVHIYCIRVRSPNGQPHIYICIEPSPRTHYFHP